MSSKVPTPEELIRELWQDLLDQDDRTSPPEYPNMALITFDEFAACIKLVAEESTYVGSTIPAAEAARLEASDHRRGLRIPELGPTS